MAHVHDQCGPNTHTPLCRSRCVSISLPPHMSACELPNDLLDNNWMELVFQQIAMTPVVASTLLTTSAIKTASQNPSPTNPTRPSPPHLTTSPLNNPQQNPFYGLVEYEAVGKSCRQATPHDNHHSLTTQPKNDHNPAVQHTSY